MKAVQVGILIALLVCAGLLFKMYQARQGAPAPVPAALAAPAFTTPPARRKPAPARSAPKPPEEVAENRAPAPEPMAPPAPPPIQAVPVPAPVEPAPTPHPAVLLNPPPDVQTAPPEPRQPHNATIPTGTLITVRLADALSSDKNHAGDAFSATLDQPLVIDGFALAERGAHVEGKVIDTGQGGKDLALQLIKLHTSDGQDVPIVTERFTREGAAATGRQSGEKVAAGAVLGAVIGAIAGGGKGAAIGAGAGGAAGGGVAAATHRKPAQLPVETRLTFRLSQPVKLTERVE